MSQYDVCLFRYNTARYAFLSNKTRKGGTRNYLDFLDRDECFLETNRVPRSPPLYTQFAGRVRKIACVYVYRVNAEIDFQVCV